MRAFIVVRLTPSRSVVPAAVFESDSILALREWESAECMRGLRPTALSNPWPPSSAPGMPQTAQDPLPARDIRGSCAPTSVTEDKQPFSACRNRAVVFLTFHCRPMNCPRANSQRPIHQGRMCQQIRCPRKRGRRRKYRTKKGLPSTPRREQPGRHHLCTEQTRREPAGCRPEGHVRHGRNPHAYSQQDDEGHSNDAIDGGRPSQLEPSLAHLTGVPVKFACEPQRKAVF
jgi:hypothetical protein